MITDEAVTDPQFLLKICFSDECTFRERKIVTIYIFLFSMKEWSAISLTGNLTGEMYLPLMKDVINPTLNISRSEQQYDKDHLIFNMTVLLSNMHYTLVSI